MEDFLTEVINCKSEEEVKKLVDETLAKRIEGSEKVEELGARHMTAYKGFIHPDIRMRCGSSTLSTYRMSTTDYLYEYATAVWKYTTYQTPGKFADGIVPFLNWYFGITVPGEDKRDDFFCDKAFLAGVYDEKFFEAMENFTIGDLRGQGIALCMERSAVAQNILSLFGFDSFFCVGVVKNGDSYEDHAFNIVRNGNKYMLIDFSKTVPQKGLNGSIIYKPYYMEISADKIEDFMNNKVAIDLEDYEYEGPNRVVVGERQYIAGVNTEEMKARMRMGS